MAASSELSGDGDDGLEGARGNDPKTALAPVWARVVAFVAVIAIGLAGALVGGRFGDVACTGSCDLVIGASMLTATVVAALGAAAVAVITLRVAGEWVGGS